MSTAVLNSEKVDAIFMDCLLKKGEDANKCVKAEGITRDVGFHSERLESHKAEIMAMLNELPDKFKETGGGGMSFICADSDKHGNQWTGLHQRIEQLFQLGIGVGKVRCLAPRNMWDTLFERIPYYVVMS